MVDTVHRFFSRLSPSSRQHVFRLAGLPKLDADASKPRKMMATIIQTVAEAPDTSREYIEAMSGHVLTLSEKGEHADAALQSVCSERADLLDVLEQDLSLEERIFLVWQKDAALLDLARNLARNFRWREGRRYHAGYKVLNAPELLEDISGAVKAIRALIQEGQGGRKVDVEQFTYPKWSGAGRSVSVSEDDVSRIHHIALYLEAPAKMLMEFQPEIAGVMPAVRREAKEMAIEYDPESGTLGVAGRGVGGGKVFEKVAEAFRRHALADAALTKLSNPEWPLNAFLRSDIQLPSPPEGYATVRVTSLLLRSSHQRGGRALFTAGNEETAYDRIRQLGIRSASIQTEWASSVTLTLEEMPRQEGNRPRELSVTLKWPRDLTYDGATVRDRKIIEAWLQSPEFLSLGQTS